VVKRTAVHFPQLDALRACCFLAVFFYYSFHTDVPAIRALPLYTFVKGVLFGNGALGVNFFFVLSGFLITYLLITEKEHTGRIHVLHFYIRRVLRIWPLYFFCVVAGFVGYPLIKGLLIGQEVHETAHPWYYLTFTSNFDVVHAQGMPTSPVLSVLWSVGVEEQFYLVWPLLLAFMPVRTYPFLFSGILMISLVFCTAHISEWWALLVHTLSCIGDLSIGALGAYFMQDPKKREWIAGQPRWSIVMVYVLFALCYFFRMPVLDAYPVLWSMDRAVIATLILFIILEQNYAERSLFKLGRFRMLTSLGRISYGLYCLHFIGILITLTLTKHLGLNTHFWQIALIEVPVSLLLTVGFARLSYRYFESPFLVLKVRYAHVSSGGAKQGPLDAPSEP